MKIISASFYATFGEEGQSQIKAYIKFQEGDLISIWTGEDRTKVL